MVGAELQQYHIVKERMINWGRLLFRLVLFNRKVEFIEVSIYTLSCKAYIPSSVLNLK